MSTQKQAPPPPSTPIVSIGQESGFTPEQIQIIKSQVCPKGTSDDELALFLMYCAKTGLDPLARQIYLSERNTRDRDTNSFITVRRPETTIDGFRLIAERTGKYCGQQGPFWCGPDGVWTDVWLKKEPPTAAKIGILRDDFKEPLYSVALYSEYVQKTFKGEVNAIWAKIPTTMIAKVAESAGLRRAFPRELSGLYTREEMPDPTEHEESGKGESPFRVGERPKAIEGPDPGRVIDMKTEQKEAVPVTNGIPKQDTGSKAAAKDEVPEKSVASSGSGSVATGQTTSPAVAPETKVEEKAPVEDDPKHESNNEAFYAMLQAFAEQKKRLGEILYYSLLKEHSGGGAKKSTEFISMALARYVFKKMLATPTPEAGPDYKAEVNEALAKISETRNPTKSVQANSKPFSAFLKGFMGGPLKPTPESIADIRMGLRLLDAIMASDKPMIVESAKLAEETGHTAAEGYAKSLNYLKGRSAIVPMAFWDLVVDRGFALTGGTECIDYFTAVGIPADVVDSELMAFMQVAMRTREAHKLVAQSRATGVPMAKIITGWSIDIDKAPVAGIDSLLNGFKAPAPVAQQPVEESDAAEPPVESTKVDEAPWGLDLFAE